MPLQIQPRGGRNLRRFVYLRLALLVPLLLAVFLLHLSGTDLVILRVARIVIVVLVLLVGGQLRARRNRAG